MQGYYFGKIEGGGPPGPWYYDEDVRPNEYNYTLPKSNITLYYAEVGAGYFMFVQTSLPDDPGFGTWEEPYNCFMHGRRLVLHGSNLPPYRQYYPAS